MSKKVFYRYNQATDSYERVYPSRSKRMWIIAKNTFEGIAAGGAILVALYILIDLPKEKRLKEQNQQLREQIADIDSRMTAAINVMDDLAERDNNLYRVIMQLDPLTASKRYSGLDRLPDPNRVASYNDKDLVNSVTARLKLFERQVYVQSLSFSELADAISQNHDRLSHIPSIQPISEKDMTQMASGYGYRIDPIYGTSKHHDGMDFASPTGTPVYATGDAEVLDAGWNSGYGNLVELNHGYNYTTRYAHLSKINVAAGQKVKRGDLIGYVGSTGKSTGSHLHYEVRFKGVPQNPVNYYFQDLTPEEYAAMVEEAENAGHVMD